MMWGHPQLLFWLAALIPAVWVAVILVRLKRKTLSRFTAAENIPVLAPAYNPKRAIQRVILRTLVFALLITALAQPRWGFRWEEIRRKGLDILVVLDTSNSMTATDIKPNRLQQAKWGIRELLGQLHGDRIGLIPFAGSSILQCPLTIDYAAFAMTVDDLYAGIIPKGGTAIEQALYNAIESFQAASSSNKADRVILLITDGEDHDGDPLRAIPKLQEENIRVYTIGIGTPEGELIPDPKGAAYLKDRQGQIVKTALKEDTLQRLAIATGGTYVRSAPGDIGLTRVFNESITQLKRTEQESRMAKIYEERFVWPLALALFLLFIEAACPDRQKANVAKPEAGR